MLARSLTTSLVRGALAGLALSPCALVAQTYNVFNTNDAAKWYFAFTPKCTAVAGVHDEFGLFLGSSCDLKVKPKDAPEAARIVVVQPKQKLKLVFGPADGKAQEYLIEFNLCDGEWSNGGGPFSRTCVRGSQGKFSQRDEGGLSAMVSNPNAVEFLEGGMATIFLHMPNWETWKTLSVKMRKRAAAPDRAGVALSIDELLNLDDLPTPEGTPNGAGTVFDWEGPETPRKRVSDEYKKPPVPTIEGGSAPIG